MIFVTVGTQVPFDRLVHAVDTWCARTGVREVFGQIAVEGGQGYRPRHFDWVGFMEPAAYERRIRQAEFVVAHAGMGTIIAALSHAKPLLIMPRRAALGEQRNDHQLATVARFRERQGVFVAAEEAAVEAGMDRLRALTRDPSADAAAISPHAETRLTDTLRRVIMG